MAAFIQSFGEKKAKEQAKPKSAPFAVLRTFMGKRKEQPALIAHPAKAGILFLTGWFIRKTMATT